MATGTVKWFDRKKGYGFVIVDNPEAEGTVEAFVHYANIVGEGYRSLVENQAVSFDLQDSDKGPLALNVQALESAEA
ncbi:MAG: cold-shock protein [Planctomycetes bacterium]|nr:cold-shock protein [Planctomycetota bacterium]